MFALQHAGSHFVKVVFIKLWNERRKLRRCGDDVYASPSGGVGCNALDSCLHVYEQLRVRPGHKFFV